MIQNFQKICKLEDIIFIMSDYHMKGKEPVICKKLEEFLEIQVIKHFW